MNHRFRPFWVGLFGFTALASVSSADVVHLKTGGRVEGVLVRETASSITIDIGMGQVSLPKSSVVSIERKDSALSEYRTRLASIHSGDVAAFANLARFSSANGLRNESRLMWSRVLSLEPGNVDAHLALGHVLAGGVYVDEAEANRAQGLIYFDGRWMTPTEQAYLLREREQRIADERREGEARRAVRDEGDRERRAEAAAVRARAAEASTIGIPVWSYGSIPWVGYGHGRGNSGRYGGSYSGGYGGGYGGTVVQPIWSPRPSGPTTIPAPQAPPLRPSSIR